MERLKLERKKVTPGFKKGNKAGVGNRGYTKEARHRKRYMMAALEHAFEIAGANPRGISKAALRICQRMLKQAEQGNNFAQKEIFDRMEGRAVQGVEITGREGKPIQMITKEMSLKEARRILEGNLDFEFGDEDNE